MYIIFNPELRTYVGEDGGYTSNIKEAAHFDTSREAAFAIRAEAEITVPFLGIPAQGSMGDFDYLAVIGRMVLSAITLAEGDPITLSYLGDLKSL